VNYQDQCKSTGAKSACKMMVKLTPDYILSVGFYDFNIMSSLDVELSALPLMDSNAFQFNAKMSKTNVL